MVTTPTKRNKNVILFNFRIKYHHTKALEERGFNYSRQLKDIFIKEKTLLNKIRWKVDTDTYIQNCILNCEGKHVKFITNWCIDLFKRRLINHLENTKIVNLTQEIYNS